MQNILIGLVSNVSISVDEEFGIVVIEYALNELRALGCIVVSGKEVGYLLPGCFQVRRCAQYFIEKRYVMKKRKTSVLRSTIKPL